CTPRSSAGGVLGCGLGAATLFAVDLDPADVVAAVSPSVRKRAPSVRPAAQRATTASADVRLKARRLRACRRRALNFSLGSTGSRSMEPRHANRSDGAPQ